MKISMELRPKDISLLKVLACVLVAFFMIRFLIFPAIDKHMDLADQRTEVETEQQEMQDVMGRTGNLDVKIAKQQELLQATKEGYYDLLENRQVDELVTGIVLDHNLFPVYLNITGTAPGVPSAYVLSEVNNAETTTDVEGTEAEDTSDSAETAQEEGSTVPQAAYVNTTSVDVTVQGNETEIRAFLDDIANNYPGIQVTSFSMQENEYVNNSLQTVSQMSCNCTLAIYTCGEN
ncbi:hypothetical protein [uncultured Eubacterium sp.]|uniref:hypothetical protein n=1 Tax=uncultured Eubacterium sp. TaxID=165185 RepID=UPI0025D39DC4|nr:hypothetical protein [uncultured Eubacterium sp.]